MTKSAFPSRAEEEDEPSAAALPEGGDHGHEGRGGVGVVHYDGKGLTPVYRRHATAYGFQGGEEGYEFEGFFPYAARSGNEGRHRVHDVEGAGEFDARLRDNAFPGEGEARAPVVLLKVGREEIGTVAPTE
jgi:hypothetical protein